METSLYRNTAGLLRILLSTVLLAGLTLAAPAPPAHAAVTFTDLGGAGLASLYSWPGAAWGDYDNDGDLDVVLAGCTDAGCVARATKLYRNDGGATFTEVASGLPGVSHAALAWADYDADGDLDLLVTGICAPNTALTDVYRNDGATFTPVQAGLDRIWSGHAAWGDYDNDGDLDVLMAGYQSPELGLDWFTRVYRRNADGSFTDVNAGLPGVTNSSTVWGDYDNDGDLDILLVGRRSGNKVYRNDNGAFTDINAGRAGFESGSAAWGDYDNDGDLDILICGSGPDPVSAVYRNDGGIFGAPGMSCNQEVQDLCGP